MKRIRKHLTYANVMTTITAFVVLAGGTAFAAGQLAKNSVGKKQLKSNAVTTAKIKKAAVTKVKIKDGAVDGSKIKDGSVNGAKVADGSLTGTDLNVAATPFSRIVFRGSGQFHRRGEKRPHRFLSIGQRHLHPGSGTDRHVHRAPSTSPSTRRAPRRGRPPRSATWTRLIHRN